MSWLKPRSIRGQLISGLILLEGLLVVGFATLLVREQASEIRDRARSQLQSEADLLALQSQEALRAGPQGYLQPIVRAMVGAPQIRAATVTDASGRAMASSDPTLIGRNVLTPAEKQDISSNAPSVIFRSADGAREAVVPIRVDGRLSGYAWIYENESTEWQQIYSLVRITLIFAGLGAFGTALIAGLLARSITRPLLTLLAATRKLIRNPETKEGFPLEVTSANEAADLTRAFNLMVTSIEEQRAGLNDTLALLDSMLENAPIGFAFFDRKYRYVRINQFLAEINRGTIGRHLGRTIGETLANPAAALLENCVRNVFESGQAVRDFELTIPGEEDSSPAGAWLLNVYPVKTVGQTVRWVGAIVVETTERKRSEEALRKTEKLAAAGRLAASIAHEINNPLEAVTNLLYLLQRQESLDDQARSYADLAQHEISRVSEVTQQTLRFYRQSTLPMVANIPELLNSVLTLHQGRLHSLQIEVTRRFDSQADLHCFSGELRQLFANLVGNAIDAMAAHGVMRLVVRRSQSWSGGEPGVRIFVEDNGSGMNDATRKRIFEPFFTTKDATGTGLGLWVSAEIIQKHRGLVRVRSRPQTEAAARGKRSGTIFMIFLPRHGVAAARPVANAVSQAV
jgi:signal transduction histidine kinase